MTPLVLLPDMMCDARLFAPQIAALSNRWSLVLPPLGSRDSVEALAAEILVHAPLRFALAGVSMGGIVAMEIVRQAPDRVLRLALIDTNPLADDEPARARRPAQIERALSGELAEVMRQDMLPHYLAGDLDDDPILDLCLDMALRHGPEVFARQSSALASRRDQRETLRGFRGPALIVVGADDRLCPRDRHELMHDLMPGSRLAVIDGAGHLPVLERPEATTAELVRWLHS